MAEAARWALGGWSGGQLLDVLAGLAQREAGEDLVDPAADGPYPDQGDQGEQRGLPGRAAHPEDQLGEAEQQPGPPDNLGRPVR